MSAESTEQRNKTCAERIAEQRDSRIADFADMLNRAGGNGVSEEEQERAQEEIYETPLAVSVFRTVRIDLSTGGPGDWLEVQLDSENDPMRAEYHFNDWFDHASVTLEGDDYETAVEFARYVTADFYFEI